MRPPVNVLRLSLHPGGLAGRILNFPEWRAHLLARLGHEVRASSDPALLGLLEELKALPLPPQARGVRAAPAEEGGIAVPLRLASEAGARVIAISRRQSSLDLARHYGAAETIVMDDHWRILEDVKRLTDGRGCDVGEHWSGRAGRPAVRRARRGRYRHGGRDWACVRHCRCGGGHQVWRPLRRSPV